MVKRRAGVVRWCGVGARTRGFLTLNRSGRGRPRHTKPDEPKRYDPTSRTGCCVMARSSTRSQSAERSHEVRHMAGSHRGIAVQPRTRRREPLQLDFAGAHDSLANLGGAFRFVPCSPFFVVHGRNVNVDIDVVKQGRKSCPCSVES
jgi:hypothetical protein